MQFEPFGEHQRYNSVQPETTHLAYCHLMQLLRPMCSRTVVHLRIEQTRGSTSILWSFVSGDLREEKTFSFFPSQSPVLSFFSSALGSCFITAVLCVCFFVFPDMKVKRTGNRNQKNELKQAEWYIEPRGTARSGDYPARHVRAWSFVLIA